ALHLAPAGHDLLLHFTRERHVIEASGHLIALAIGPLEEFQRFASRRLVLWLLVDKHERCARNRPSRITWLVREKRAKAIGGIPGGAGGRRGKGRSDGGDRLAGFVDHLGVGKVVL